MKLIKLFSVVALAAMTVSVNAATEARAYIYVNPASNASSDVVKLFQDPTATDAFEVGLDATKMMNDDPTSVNLYGKQGTSNVQTLKTNDLSNIALIFKANSTETTYTLKFKNLMGDIVLYDAVENITIPMEENGSYEFTCEADATLTDRFIVNPVGPSICHRW